MNSQRVRTSSYIFEEFMVWFDISHDDFAEIISKNGMYFQSVAKMSEIVGMQLEKRLSLFFENYFTWSVHFPFVKQH